MLAELGIDISTHTATRLIDELIAAADLVVVLGTGPRRPGSRHPHRNLDTDEPSERGIVGPDRMRLIRDDIAKRVDALAHELGLP